ncbi:ribosome biogenesis GTPase YlqF [Mycoplasma sp. Mirounga ES2805-ORL]|uniref:ribosome biogenesis GTPase YlqF n=1 Tax=Mycoplasma sp. Mirounga ES2805-ORL TaxID=754514 RepID=UPI00197B269E|nr:ribosome biogenesis GTPase YlqF [Mycoplasma sp. Mirounga ES2805-ORL]QSF13493.1 ribosome biogenesis GTPase YlqF [Mycoplasma sp. Mirounga ES2805-ORL]
MNYSKTLINWYPGHMAKGMREIKENSSLCDIFIIVLDARCPISSYNEDFDSIEPNKPRLFVITKSDMMDQTKKNLIQSRFKNEILVWANLKQNSTRKLILKNIKKLSAKKEQQDKDKGFMSSKIKIFVLGVPNAGKSTLINLLSQKKSLKVANYPGVTRGKQWVNVDNYYFMDTPGILLPKLEDQEAATKLAMIGSIDTKSLPLRFLANSYLNIFNKYYNEKIFNDLKIQLPNEEINEYMAHNFFAQLFKLQGFKGDINNLNQAYTFFINYIREASNITLD